MTNQLVEQFMSPLADFIPWNANCGERNSCFGTAVDIVKSDHPQVFGNTYSAFMHRLLKSHGDQIIKQKDAVDLQVFQVKRTSEFISFIKCSCLRPKGEAEDVASLIRVNAVPFKLINKSFKSEIIRPVSMFTHDDCEFFL